MSIIFNQETNLYEYIETKQNSKHIDIKSIDVGERLKIEDEMILKFMIRKLYEDKLRAEQKIRDLKIRLNAAEESLEYVVVYDRPNQCCKCKLIFHEKDEDFGGFHICIWCNYSHHCGDCLPAETYRECLRCQDKFSTKCVTDDKYKDCCGDRKCKTYVDEKVL